jgi:hypothetical protein
MQKKKKESKSKDCMSISTLAEQKKRQIEIKKIQNGKQEKRKR